ncbi:MAG: LAGLIDADG family homing endonuclease [archaeon]|nr:LAGLIDADG family homing endonuclease [archaeon]
MGRNKFQRLSKDEKKTIWKLTEEGKSLNKISRLMGINKNTVYYNVLQIKPKINRKIIFDNISEKEGGELIGAFAGDGSYYHQNYDKKKKNSVQHRIRYHLSLQDDIDYAKYMLRLLKKINLNPHIIKNEKIGRLDISLSSKSFIELIKKHLIWKKNKTLTIGLKHHLKNYSRDFLVGFARGLMDTDGYVEISNASCACISKRLIHNLISIFDFFKIKYKLTEKVRKNRKKLFLVRVYRESLNNYFEIMGFSNPYKLKALKQILKRGYRKD